MKRASMAALLALPALCTVAPAPAGAWQRPASAEVYLADVNSLMVYAGVGMDRNPVARLRGAVGGRQVNDPARFTAQIDWGDGGGWQKGEIGVTGDGGGFIVKGSHNYTRAGDYDVQVRATLDGTTSTRTTTRVQVLELPDARARPVQPARSFVAGEPKEVSLYVADVNSISSYAGVGFERNPVARLRGAVDGTADTDPAGYHVQINWGDSGAWTAGEIALNASGDGFLLKGSHVYARPGSYPVVVHVAGPDGQTLDRQSTRVQVSAMPSARSRPITTPRASRTGAPLEVDVYVADVNSLRAQTGRPLTSAVIARVSATMNGVRVTSAGDIRAQVNWGDDGSWTAASVVPGDRPASFLVQATHTYRAAGTYPVVVHVAGPDGQTVGRQTTSVFVTSAPPAGTPPPP